MNFSRESKSQQSSSKATDPTLVVALAKALEKGINAALSYDPGTRLKLRKLRGSTFQFECSSPKLTFFFEVNEMDDDVVISGYSESSITTKVSGSLFDILVFFASSEGPGSPGGISSLANSGISILGNSAKLANLQSLMQNLDVDWEQALIDLNSPLGESGKVISHQLATVIKSFLHWIKESRIKFKTNIASYLGEELRVIPTKPELDAFYEGVTALRSNAERLQARIAALTAVMHSS